jgi:isocitrate dehydrogenase (NAD+)
MKHVVIMPGDGIGRVVVPQALRVLDAVGFKAEYVRAEIGWDLWRTTGHPLPEATIALLEEHRLGLFGAITSKPAQEAQRALSPHLRDRGLRYQSPILELRRRLGLGASIRPCRTWRGNPTNFIRNGAQGVETPPVDITVVMQNTEGLYAGIGWSGLPEPLRTALESHPNMTVFADAPSDQLALSCRLLSRAECRRIAGVAFSTASAQGRTHVTLCDKWGVMQETASMLLDAAKQEEKSWPDIALRTENVDALLVQLLRTPERYGVILCGALVGDIVSDAACGLVGGLGFAPCANLGDACAVFEPTHGSAPDIAQDEPSRANPIAAILAAAMLCEHAGDNGAATRIRDAIETTVDMGETRTPDMLPLEGTGPSATAEEMTNAIIAALGRA